MGAARRLVCNVLAEIGSPGLAEEAELLVSELATNALTHGGGAFEVVVGASRAGLWVARAEGGRGLWLVDHLADRWGATPPGRTERWCGSGSILGARVAVCPSTADIAAKPSPAGPPMALPRGLGYATGCSSSTPDGGSGAEQRLGWGGAG